MLTLCSFSMQFAMQKDKENLSLHHMGNYLLFNLLRYNLKPEGLHFLKVFRNLNVWDGLPVFTQQLIYRVKTETKQSIMLTLYPQHDNPPAYLILTPIGPYFYIATLGDYGVYIIFYGCSLEPPHRDGPNVTSTNNLCSEQN